MASAKVGRGEREALARHPWSRRSAAARGVRAVTRRGVFGGYRRAARGGRFGRRAVAGGAFGAAARSAASTSSGRRAIGARSGGASSRSRLLGCLLGRASALSGHLGSVASSTVVAAAAEPLQRQRPERAVAARACRSRSHRFQRVGAERRERGVGFERAGRVEQRASAENTARGFAARARTTARRARQAAAPAAPARRRSPGCRAPSPGSAIREQVHTRFVADIAQPLRVAARRRRKRSAKPRDVGAQAARRRSKIRSASAAGVAAPSARRAARIGPEHAACVRRPQPRRRSRSSHRARRRASRVSARMVGCVHFGIVSFGVRGADGSVNKPLIRRGFSPRPRTRRDNAPRSADNLNAAPGASSAAMRHCANDDRDRRSTVATKETQDGQ